MTSDLITWVLAKLEAVKDCDCILVRDSLRLLPESEGALHRFANDNGFTVIVTSTNLVFRELFEKAALSKDVNKLLLVDRAPARRRAHASTTKAPPPFYPDLLAKTPETARIDVNLRQFLIETTGDPNWPRETNDPRFAKLISGHLENVVKAHGSLRVADRTRFTDHDFQTMVAYSALGVPEAAFKRPEAKTYWRVGLFGYQALEELDSLAPKVAKSIRDELRAAPSPFCWFADHPPEIVVRAFYLATILSQHLEHWKLLLTNLDSELKPFTEMKTALIREAAQELVALDSARAHEDLLEVESSLSRDALNLILLDQLKLGEDQAFVQTIENEQYSVLIRSLALLLALDNLLSATPLMEAHEKVSRLLAAETVTKAGVFIEQRPSAAWENLRAAYNLARSIRDIQDALAAEAKNLRLKQTAELSFEWFWSLWNELRANRLEYYFSALERRVVSSDFLPRPAEHLPPFFGKASDRITERIGSLRNEIQGLLSSINSRFQDLIAAQYQSWIDKDSQPLLTSQFLRRCLKPNWDPKNEKAAVFVFDGMRYDIWDELVRPIFEDRMEIIKDYPAVSLLPSETHVSRKAIFAGTFPDSFDMKKGEDGLLRESLKQSFDYGGEIETVAPEGMGTGETVRYRAHNADIYIFELCDKELHNIRVKTLPDGRCVPGRPLAFIYQQHIKDIIDTEVMAIVRGLPADTKVFVVADHGFGAIGREPLRVEASWLNEPTDCFYQNAWLRQTLKDVHAPQKIRGNTLEFPVADLHMPDAGEAYDRSQNRSWQKKFAAIIFPRTGYALARPKSHFNPDAYSHGGISIQEMVVPMVAMRVKAPEEGLLVLNPIEGPTDIIEGEEAEFRLPVSLISSKKGKEIRVEARAVYQNREETASIPQQVIYVSAPGAEIVFRFKPDATDASDEEVKKGLMARTLIISVTHREGRRTVRKARTLNFSVRINPSKIVRRVPTHLGQILGLTPKSMK